MADPLSSVREAAPLAASIDLPEPFFYRLKRVLLGPPLVTERLSEERLGKPTALGVLSPDCISSTAYGTEEMLTVLVPAAGVAAFSLLLPITFAVLGVLFFVTLSYREVVMAYTRAGGAYVVARENFGPRIAQIAAVALIIDYVVTVAVQTAAGTDALTSAFPLLTHWSVEITIGVVLVLCYGNLRGVREAGRLFALPTYLFIFATGSVIVVGVVRDVLGQLHRHSIHVPGAVPAGHPGTGLLYGATLFVVMRSFANGGSSLTGLEAISNGVATFRPPEGVNARRVLVVMAIVLGSLVLGVSYLAYVTHAVPFVKGSPTVLSQEARYVFGSSLFGRFGFYAVQGVTMLILYTGANTSFNGFPNLASFVAEDAFLPRQLTRRGHRLVFSNGILILTVLATALLLVTRARVDALVAVYAIGVFTGFTMAGAGMVRYHLRDRRPGFRHRLLINGFAALLSGIVVLIFAVTKFTEGAWAVVVLFPLLVALLIHLNRVYRYEKSRLEHDVQAAAEAPVLRRHIVLVLVERFDLAVARALQYGRSLATNDPRAIHFVLDPEAAGRLEAEWVRLGLSRVSLELVECPDRRLGRAVIELVAGLVADGETEVTVLLPRRVFDTPFRRVLHDRTSERIGTLVSELPNAAATIIPYRLGRRRRYHLPWEEDGATTTPNKLTESLPSWLGGHRIARETREEQEVEWQIPIHPPQGATAIALVRPREISRVAGRVHSVRVEPKGGPASFEVELIDPTGALWLVFQGRRLMPGLEPGVRLSAEGMVARQGGRLLMTNPSYTILP